jgi:PleD family two-component response regulator
VEADARGLISRADEALYQAKAEGENTIVHLD